MTSFNPDRGKLRWQLKDKLLSEGRTSSEICSDAGLIEAAVKKVFDSIGVEKIEAARKEKPLGGYKNLAKVGYVQGTCREYEVRLTFGESNDLLIFAHFSKEGHKYCRNNQTHVWASIRMLREVTMPKP